MVFETNSKKFFISGPCLPVLYTAMALNATLDATLNATSNATLAASDVVSWSGLLAAIASPLMMTVGFVVSTGTGDERAMRERREREARERREERERASASSRSPP